MADKQDTPPNTANTIETEEQRDDVVVSTMHLGNITPPTEATAVAGSLLEHLQDDRELFGIRSSTYDGVKGGVYPHASMKPNQPGPSNVGTQPQSTQDRFRPHYGASETEMTRGERGPAVERGRQNQAYRESIENYHQESSVIKRKLKGISTMMLTYAGEHQQLSMRKQVVQCSMQELKELEEGIQETCHNSEVSEDYAILVTTTNAMIESFRNLCPYASSDMVSTIWSSSPGSIHQDNQAYKEMIGKKTTLGDQETEALTELEQQRHELRRLQETLEDEKRSQARQAQRLVEEQKEKDQEELETQQRRVDENKRLDDETIRKEKASKEKSQKLLERELKDQIDENIAEKAKVVRRKLDEIEVKKTEVSAHFKQQVRKAEEDMMAEIEQPLAPPPSLMKIDMINVMKKGPSSLDGIKKAVLDEQETKNVKAKPNVVSQEGSGLPTTEVIVSKVNEQAPLMQPPRNSTPITSFQDPPSGMQTAATSQPTVQNNPRHNFRIVTGERPNRVAGKSIAATNYPIQMSEPNARTTIRETTTYAPRNVETPAAMQRVQQQVLNQIENRMRATTRQNLQQEEERNQYTSAEELNPAADAFFPGYQRPPVSQLQGEQSFASAEHIAATQLLASSIKQSRLPRQEPLTFEGDPLLYSAWKNTFTLIIEAQDISEVERLLYLQNYVKGAAKNAISGALASASPTAYSSAMATLDERFGSPVIIATAYREKLESWPVVGMKDADSLRKMADFLNECLSATRYVGQTAIFEDVLYQKKILDKLPDWMRRKWQRNYSETRQHKNRYPTFSEFVKYVNDEATIANEPGWTQSKGTTDSARVTKRPNTYNTSKAQQNKPSEEAASINRRLNEVMKELGEIRNVQSTSAFQATPQNPNTWMGPPMRSDPRASPGQHSSTRSCAYCQTNDHSLCECRALMRLPPHERRAVFVENRLCFRCGDSSHYSTNCPRHWTCHECQKGHPTVLHGTFTFPLSNQKPHTGQQQTTQPQRQGYYRPPNDSRNGSGPYSNGQQNPIRDSNQTTPKLATLGIQTANPDQSQSVKSVGAGIVQKSTAETSTQTVTVHCSSPVRTTMIVPVYVSSAEEPTKEILTYALLDTQAGVTFVAEELAKQLKTRGYSHPLRINTMTAKNRLTPSTAVLNLRVRAVDSRDLLSLPVSYSTDILSVNPQTIPTPEIATKYEHLKHLAPHLMPYDSNCCAGLLIGYDNPVALMPTEVIQGTPYAIKTCLGWSVIGEQQLSHSVDGMMTSTATAASDSLYMMTSGAGEEQGLPQVVSNVFRTQVQEATTTDILRLLERDFVENESGYKSQEDTKFLEIMNKSIRKNSEGHYEMPLPFKEEDPVLPCNRHSAVMRLHGLGRQLSKDNKKRELYVESMAKLLEQGHAERVPETEMNNTTKWYIPHHGVVSDKKPDKIRVVFDCSAQYKGTALNDHLLQGPDLINPLIGVLLRFRNGKVAVSCDIRQMYHQFYVAEPHRDYFRFLWWENGDLNNTPLDYRMKVHIFGATSSPGCANFGLKRLALEYEEQNPESARFLREDFYVDDGLCASEDVETAVRVLKGAREICEKANLKLHKITSNDEELLTHFPQEDLAKATCKDLGEDETSPVERILGLQWDTKNDVFTFPTSCKEKPLTKRGMLSTIASLYDPLGFIGPLILKGRVLLQQVCREKGDWDDPLPESVREDWTRWQRELTHLDEISIPRSFVPNCFANITKRELHHFSDASEGGYGQCSYLRLQDENNDVHCSLVMAKSRVTPLKTTTIPRLELQAATLSVRMAKFLDEQLHMNELSHHFWTDSAIVLAYLANKSKRFHVFVANRVGEILRDSDISQWAHVATEKNPADIASRGATAIELDHSTWYQGPQFLWASEVVKESATYSVPENDVEVNVKATTVSSSTPSDMESRIQRSSSWRRLVRGMALVFRKWTKTFRQTSMSERQLEEIVERRLIQTAQNEFLSNPSPNASNAMKQLNCARDQNGVIVVNGRMKNPETLPILLPQESRITRLIVEQMHQGKGHPGRTTTIHHLREAGLWILGFRRIVDSTIKSCAHCTRTYGKLMEQRMSDLPSERTDTTLPFTRCGIDCFGPFITKEGRKELKRYGLLVTCLSTRAVHLEMLDNMTTDAFLNALRNIVAIRGEIKYIRSDRGTNFVGASRVLKREWDNMSKDELQKRCMREQRIEWVFNPPSASHTGGVWERLIRSARRILNGLLSEANTHLTPSTLRTLLYEVMAIMNSRPLSTESLEDPSGPLPLTPNHILTFKSTGILPPPGIFTKEDLNHRSLWKKVQHIADRFWEKWRTDYFTTLQTRRKWHHAKPNIAVHDVVLLKDENLCRSQWRMGRVVKVHVSDDGLVRRCRLLVANPAYQPQGSNKTAATTSLERHIHSLVLLVKGGGVESDVGPEEANNIVAPVREQKKNGDEPVTPATTTSRRKQPMSKKKRTSSCVPVALRRLKTTLTTDNLRPRSSRAARGTQAACTSPDRGGEANLTSRRPTSAVLTTKTAEKSTATTLRDECESWLPSRPAPTPLRPQMEEAIPRPSP